MVSNIDISVSVIKLFFDDADRRGGRFLRHETNQVGFNWLFVVNKNVFFLACCLGFSGTCLNGYGRLGNGNGLALLCVNGEKNLECLCGLLNRCP